MVKKKGLHESGVLALVNPNKERLREIEFALKHASLSTNN
jgi:hypothetical protein